jgi:transcriptional regulator with XRE-family HTH domain
MQKSLSSSAIKTALGELGWSQKELADNVGVTAQAVTNWLKGTDFPRPDKLLKLATVLKLRFSELVDAQPDQPVVAFKKRGGTKTTEEHLLKAKAMGAMLKPLVPYLPSLKALRTKISNPSVEYNALQNAAGEVRHKLGIGKQASLRYEHIISEFDANDAVIVPVMWGQKDRHENALHILLPKDQVTFIYLNLDTYIEDFKFWMCHELAHVYTPELAGKDEGEDFADAFAGALLFPFELARAAHTEAVNKHSQNSELAVLARYAFEHEISIATVYWEVQKYAKAMGLSLLRTEAKGLHVVRTQQRGNLVSEILFRPAPPAPEEFIACAHAVFQSHFFEAMRKLFREKGTASGYLQQVLDISIQDAAALHFELVR